MVQIQIFEQIQGDYDMQCTINAFLQMLYEKEKEVVTILQSSLTGRLPTTTITVVYKNKRLED